ncbi:Uncharacterized protein HZ326_23241 [Fusarium oxysporum f. sp. albedinis]|nr:Uncharacterized protein HZ326_23241 [Fusarium oxysporum f. sp. albedinis]
MMRTLNVSPERIDPSHRPKRASQAVKLGLLEQGKRIPNEWNLRAWTEEAVHKLSVFVLIHSRSKYHRIRCWDRPAITNQWISGQYTASDSCRSLASANSSS